MTIRKGFVVIYRILMLAAVIWFSFASELVFGKMYYSKMTVDYVLFALFLSAILLVIIALDLVLNTKFKKQNNDAYYKLSKNMNGASFAVLFFLLVLPSVFGGFLWLFTTIVPAVGIIASFADFARLLWIIDD